MRGGALPPALLAAALGFALAFAPRRALVPGMLVFALLAVLTSLARPPAGWTDAVFLGCWASVILCAAIVHLPGGPGVRTTVLLAANAAAWAGLVIAMAGAPLDLAKALPCVLLALPARWICARGLPVAVKVVASWLVAVAVLAATIPLTPTPGYVPDHMQ